MHHEIPTIAATYPNGVWTVESFAALVDSMIAAENRTRSIPLSGELLREHHRLAIQSINFGSYPAGNA